MGRLGITAQMVDDTLNFFFDHPPTSTIYTPVSGTIAKVNADLKDHPEVVNSDPYGKGWMVVVDLSNAGEVEQLMTAAQYEAFLASQKH
jgi:glycine cleavage system H protein